MRAIRDVASWDCRTSSLPRLSPSSGWRLRSWRPNASGRASLNRTGPRAWRNLDAGRVDSAQSLTQRCREGDRGSQTGAAPITHPASHCSSTRGGASVESPPRLRRWYWQRCQNENSLEGPRIPRATLTVRRLASPQRAPHRLGLPQSVRSLPARSPRVMLRTAPRPPAVPRSTSW
jgi:hypothetical protein